MTINHSWMQNNTYAARIDRLGLESLVGEEGVLGYKSMEVIPSGSTLSVDVGIGYAAIKGDDQSNQGIYLVHNDASVNVVFSAPGSDSWYVGIILQVRDPNATGPAGDDVILTTVVGSSSGSPTKPTVPDSALVLTWLIVPSSATIGTDATDELYHPMASLNPTGMIIPWAGPTTAILPNGWLLCDGTEANRTTYEVLFALVGTLYGVGNGSTTFDLPDLRGRMPLGLDNMGGVSANRVTDASADSMGGSSGASTHTLTEAEIPSHLHAKGTLATANSSPSTGGGGSHSHAIDHNHSAFSTASAGTHFHAGKEDGFIIDATTGGSILTSGGAGAKVFTATETDGAHTHSIDVPNHTGSSGSESAHTHTVNAHNHAVTGSTANTGSGSAHKNMPPYLALQYLIKT